MKQLEKTMCADSSLAQCSELWQQDGCVDITAAQVAAYPPLTMNLKDGVVLRMTSKDYLLLGSPLAKSAGQYCLGIRDGCDFLHDSSIS